MSIAPHWLENVIGEFGRTMGIETLSLGERGALTLQADHGIDFHLEYAQPDLIVRMTVPVTRDVETAKRVLALAEPIRRSQWAIHSGFMPHADKAFFVVRLAQDAVTIPVLMDVFRALNRLVGRFVGGAK